MFSTREAAWKNDVQTLHLYSVTCALVQHTVDSKKPLSSVWPTINISNCSVRRNFFSAGFLNNPFDTYCLSHFYCHVDNGDGGNMLARSSEDRESFAERPAKRVRQACEPCR